MREDDAELLSKLERRREALVRESREQTYAPRLVPYIMAKRAGGYVALISRAPVLTNSAAHALGHPIPTLAEYEVAIGTALE